MVTQNVTYTWQLILPAGLTGSLAGVGAVVELVGTVRHWEGEWVWVKGQVTSVLHLKESESAMENHTPLFRQNTPPFVMLE